MLALGLGALAVAQDVSVGTLLPQMTNLDLLTRRPRPWFKTEQASSYDRASKSPAQDWFANGDAGKFLRTETVGARREYVMADLKGPGAVVRIWSANPAGTARFYFDGEQNPRFVAKLADLLTGKVAPLVEPFAYTAAMGTDLYYPLPYSRSLKITVDDGDEDKARALYYQIGYRTYEPRTRVRSFQLDDLDRYRSVMDEVAAKLRNPDAAVPQTKLNLRVEPRPLPAGQATSIPISGGGVIRRLAIHIPFPLVQTLKEMDWADPHQPHNVLRQTRLSIIFDGHETVSVPLGDFFGSAPGLNPFRTYPFEVTPEGLMICRLPMPFQSTARISIINGSAVEYPVSMNIDVDRTRPARRAYALHAQWSAERGSTRPMRDMTFLKATGEGVFVGTNLHVTNPVPAWWGEGDEKVYVDGETFPSTFGTGTEDYYGYAWCCPDPFTKPYHAQPRVDGPGNMGHTSVNRWHILDPLPFERSFKFDMEMWHWAEVDATFARTAYWYAPPGSASPEPLSEALLLPRNIEKPKPVQGALEGEKLTIESRTGGTTSVQTGFWELSNGAQLWWVDPKPGDRLVLKVPVAESGRYEVIGNFCHAADYGIHRIFVNGKEAGVFDFFGQLSWKRVSLGTFDLEKGEATMVVESVGADAKAQPRRMFGLDYLLLKKL